jgi:hypothetical protein
LSPGTGKGGSAGTIVTVTGSGFSVAGTSQVSTVEFQNAACGALNANSAVAATAKSVVSATKLVVTAPSLALGASSAAKTYYLCAFNSSTLLGSAKYTVYPLATISNASPAPVVPTAGPSFGGQAVTVTGTNFTAKTTATLGGQPITGIKVNTAGTSFTGLTPAHASGAVSLVVTTEAGPVTKASAFTYSDAIQLTGAVTGPHAGGTVIDIKGQGFLTNLTGANAGVVLVQGAYVDSSNEGTACTNLQIQDDSTANCTVPAQSADGTYSVVAVDDTTATPTYQTVISSGATFTYADF